MSPEPLSFLSSKKFHNSPQYPTAPYSVVPLIHFLLIQPVSNDKRKMSLKTSIKHTFVSNWLHFALQEIYREILYMHIFNIRQNTAHFTNLQDFAFILNSVISFNITINLLLLKKWIDLPLSELHIFLPPPSTPPHQPIMNFIISSPKKSIYKVVHKDAQ